MRDFTIINVMVGARKETTKGEGIKGCHCQQNFQNTLPHGSKSPMTLSLLGAKVHITHRNFGYTPKSGPKSGLGLGLGLGSDCFLK